MPCGVLLIIMEKKFLGSCGVCVCVECSRHCHVFAFLRRFYGSGLFSGSFGDDYRILLGRVFAAILQFMQYGVRIIHHDFSE